MLKPNKPKRILYVENGIGYGGAIICLRHLVRNLDRNRFLPLVITGRTGPQYQEISKEAEWRHIPDRHLNVINWQQNSFLLARLRKASNLLLWCYQQALARADDFFNFLPFFINLLWVSWHFKADLIHTNNEPLCNRAALLVGKLLKIPVISHVRGNLEGSRLMRWAYSLPSHFISVSNWVANGLQAKLAIKPSQITVVYDGIELDKLDITADRSALKKQFNIPQQNYTVGLVGLLIPWKGQNLFIDAAKILEEKIPHLKMLIIGGTPDDCVEYADSLRQRVISENLADIIEFTGHFSNMPIVYNGLDVVVSASTQPEPLGTVVIEAMAMGRPLIGPNHGGAAEMMAHEKTGLLFENNNAESLATMIERFYLDSAFASEIGRNAREHALQTFAVETHVNKIQDLYDEILAARSRQ